MEKENLRQGILEWDLFTELCKVQNVENKALLIWNYLIKFKLAFPLESDQLFVPAILSGADKVD